MDAIQDLRGFSQFVADRLAAGDSALPEECLTLWRAQHPLPAELADSLEALGASLDDLAAGLTHEFGTVNNDIRSRHGWNGP